MRALAASRGIEMTVTAASDAELRALLHTTSVLLVGPHLASTFAAIEAEAAIHGTPAALLPATAFGPTGAEDAMQLVESLVSTKGTPHA